MLSSVESSSFFVSSTGNGRRRSSRRCIRRNSSVFFLSLFLGLTTPSWLSNGKVKTTTTTTAFEPQPMVISITAGRHCLFSSSTARFQQSPSSLSTPQQPQQPQYAALQSALQTVQYLMDSGSMEDRKRGSFVEQRVSTIPGAGFGLFATKSIQAGTIVSYYPVHRIGVEYDTDTDDDGCADADVYSTISVSLEDSINQFGVTYNHESGARPSDYLHFLLGKRPLAHRGASSDSTKELFSGGSLFIDSNPQRPLVSGWMSHLVNDGATVQANTEQGVLNYYATSRQVKNCVHVPFGPSPILATVTTRKVKKGQELFTTYGCSYWLDALLSTDPYLPQNDDDVVVCTDITDAIQVQVTETARDILMTMQGVVVRRQQEESGLHGTYEAAMHREDP